MKNREYLMDLFEEYRSLLTEKQINYFKNYYFEDLSLNEIAESYGVTKSLVGKTINQIEDKLITFESKLKINDKMKELKKIISKTNDKELKKELEKILYK